MRFFPIGPAARRAKCCPEWIRELCNRGTIPHFRDEGGRRLISEDALTAFIAKRRGKRHRRSPHPADEATSGPRSNSPRSKGAGPDRARVGETA